MNELDKRVGNLEIDVGILKETAATKTDLSEAKTEIIKWNLGTILALTGLIYAIIKIWPLQ